MKKYDIVYYYVNSKSDELKYSIRSALKNLNVNRVFIVGDKPEWFKQTERSIYVKSVIPIEKFGLGAVPILHMVSFIKSGKCPDEFLLFNDDFFIMKKIDEWVDYYRDEDDYQRKATTNHHYHMRTLRSLTFLNGTIEGKKYNLHIPIKINKNDLIEMIELWKHFLKKDIDFRTYYGNKYINAELSLEDPKVMSEKFEYNGQTFISTSNESFKYEVGDFIKSEFQEPSFLEMI